jgi:hypothetical protein
MRTTIIWWSAASGAVLGVFIDAILLGVALLFSAVLPAREFPRWVLVLGWLTLVGVLFVMTVLGYLEGRLKSV